MTGKRKRQPWWRRWPAVNRWGLGARAAVLFLALVLVLAVVGPLAYYVGGWAGVEAASVSWAICAVSGLAALLATEPLRRPEAFLYHMLLGMAVRTGVPLACFLWIYARGGPLVDAGLVYYLLIFYYVMLMTEVFLGTVPSETAN